MNLGDEFSVCTLFEKIKKKFNVYTDQKNKKMSKKLYIVLKIHRNSRESGTGKATLNVHIVVNRFSVHTLFF